MPLGLHLAARFRLLLPVTLYARQAVLYSVQDSTRKSGVLGFKRRHRRARAGRQMRRIFCFGSCCFGRCLVRAEAPDQSNWVGSVALDGFAVK